MVFGYFGIDNIDAVMLEVGFLVDRVYASCLTDGTVSGLKQAFVDICTHLKNIFALGPGIGGIVCLMLQVPTKQCVSK